MVSSSYEATEPTRAQIDALQGATLLEFGSPSCGWCRAAEPLIAEALAGHTHIRHVRVADGSGRRLGRSFGVKLWPTLVFLKDGRETARLVRPGSTGEVAQTLSRIDP